jgi:hypothetical protein
MAMVTAHQNLWDSAEAMPRGKLVTTNAHIEKQEDHCEQPMASSPGEREKRTSQT